MFLKRKSGLSNAKGLKIIYMLYVLQISKAETFKDSGFLSG